MQLIADGRFLVKKSLPTVGYGLYAVRDIKKGAFILEYTGERLPSDVAEATGSRYLFEIDEKWTINGPVPENPAGYINHACDPNTEAVVEEDDDGVDHIMIYAIRDIASGEELTIDYGEEYFKEYIAPVGCMCEGCLYVAA